jgi:enterochelin esterase family protein
LASAPSPPNVAAGWRPSLPPLRYLNGGTLSPFPTEAGHALKQAAKTLKLAYYAYGREDFVARNTDQLKGTLKKYGIHVTLHETGGGRTWINWREYLNDLVPRLFK